MDAPDPIPLGEAAARDLLPCSVCGAKGADVRRVEGRKHLLCAACAARGRRWTRGAVAGGAVVLAVIVWSLFRAPAQAPPPPQIFALDPAQVEQQIMTLLKEGHTADAQVLIGEVLATSPNHPLFNLYMARCCRMLGQFERSLPHWQLATADAASEPECRFRIAEALQQLGHSLKALAFLEKPFAPGPLENGREPLLAAIEVDLERYPDALRRLDHLPPDPILRHRALLYSGKPDEARKLFVDGPAADPILRAQALSGQAREEADFAAALRILDEEIARHDPGSVPALRLRRSKLAVLLESNDLKGLESESTGLLAKAEDPRVRGEARWYRVMGRLLAGNREGAVADAKEFLGQVDRAMGWLRLEILTMEHLVGLRKESEIETEGKALNRFRANDLFFGAALVTGKIEWTERAAAATPGRNFPHHAIQRLLKK